MTAPATKDTASKPQQPETWSERLARVTATMEAHGYQLRPGNASEPLPDPFDRKARPRIFTWVVIEPMGAKRGYDNLSEVDASVCAILEKQQQGGKGGRA